MSILMITSGSLGSGNIKDISQDIIENDKTFSRCLRPRFCTCVTQNEGKKAFLEVVKRTTLENTFFFSSFCNGDAGTGRSQGVKLESNPVSGRSYSFKSAFRHTHILLKCPFMMLLLSL
jgi:hypothetical protein